VLTDKLRPGVILYGPYLRSDGRKHVIIYWPDATKQHKDWQRKTISYPKWLMEQHLGRILQDNETVDHKNRDFRDDRLDNLQVLTKSEHFAADAVRLAPQTVSCVWCKVNFTIQGRLADRCRNGKAGPFCSRRCSGQYGAKRRGGEVAEAASNRPDFIYYRRPKCFLVNHSDTGALFVH